LLLSGLLSTRAPAQTDSTVRPRRAETSDTSPASHSKTPTPEANAEAKKLYKSGVKFNNDGRFKDAANNFEQAVKLNPDYADCYLGPGQAYYNLHQWAQAIDSFEHGLSLKPKDKAATDRLAHARLMLERENGGREEKTVEDGDTSQGDGAQSAAN